MARRGDRFHDLLNETLFVGLDYARQVIGSWPSDDNTARPHSSLGYQTPTAYAVDLTTQAPGCAIPTQLHRSPVAPTALQGVSTAEALTAAAG